MSEAGSELPVSLSTDGAAISAWGWAGALRDFATVRPEDWLRSLQHHHHTRLRGLPLGSKQVEAWRHAFPLLQASATQVIAQRPELASSLIAFEYELPGEAGRRPDVVIVTPNGHLVVVECKDRQTPVASDYDQVIAYARDLGEYHSSSHALRIHRVLALTRPGGRARSAPSEYSVFVTNPMSARLPALEQLLVGLAGDTGVAMDPLRWLDGEYAPLPSLIRAAVDTFNGHPLPSIKAIRATNVPRVLAWLNDLASSAQRNHRHALVLLTGTPGSGKTLIGIQSVVDQADRGVSALYLSGNGPLVGVLQDALDRLHDCRPSRSLIRGMMEFKRNATRSASHSPARFYVFDEGQRAWNNVQDFCGSEIQLLIDVASRREWGVVVALIGEGQEIWQREDGSLSIWLRDIASAPLHSQCWDVYAADEDALDHAPSVSGVTFHLQSDLHLDVSLRSKQIARLHEWVNALLSSSSADAVRSSAGSLHADGFPVYLAQSRAQAETAVRGLYSDSVDKRYGWIASSRSTPAKHPGGMPLLEARPPYRAPRVFGSWFNAPSGDPDSCCALRTACKEFGCQGLELDFVLLQWGPDLLWRGSAWHVPAWVRRQSEKPIEHTFNAYRVLLTRAREGMIVACDDAETRGRLEACGVSLLDDSTYFG